MRTALLAALIFTATAQADTPGDLVLRHGAIYTMDAEQPWVTALVIHDGRIAYVGDDAGAQPYMDKGARVLDLHGAMVLPGFHDSHIHPLAGAIRLLQCDLSHAQNLQDIETAIKADAVTNPTRRWVFCNNLELVPAGGLNRERLDAWVPDRPVFVRSTDGLHAWVNSKALQSMGIDPYGTEPKSIDLPRDPAGHPWGGIDGPLLERMRNSIPPPTPADYREALRRFDAMANAYGITSVFDAAATPEMLDTYHAADLAGELTLHVTAAQQVDSDQGPDQVDAMVKRRDQMRGKRFNADAAKIFLDGEIVQHIASMIVPYEDDPKSQGTVIPQDQLDAMVQKLDSAGFLIHMRAMSDGAVRAGLDGIEYAMQKDGAADRRDQIAHVGLANPADIPRFAKLGVIADFTPLWFQSDNGAYIPASKALAPLRGQWMYPMGSVVATGAHVTIGSDWPQDTFNPLDEIQYAMTRRPLDLHLPPPQPEQVITVAQAIAAYTKEGAYAVRDEKLDGTLEVGKAADIVVLDQDLFKIDVMSIHTTHVLLTLLDGQPVYRDPKLDWPQ